MTTEMQKILFETIDKLGVYDDRQWVQTMLYSALEAQCGMSGSNDTISCFINMLLDEYCKD